MLASVAAQGWEAGPPPKATHNVQFSQPSPSPIQMFTALAFGGCSAIAGDPVLPDWEPTWDMPQSTIIMPCNYSGYTTDPVVSKFGIIDYDWSNARFAWVNNAPMNCQDRLVKQAQITKAGAKPGSNTKVFVYRNLVKALPWYDQVREKLLDPSYSGWFLKFKEGGAPGLPPNTWNVPNCNIENGEKKCSEFYHDQVCVMVVNCGHEWSLFCYGSLAFRS
jgi:hypothetical protein